jgi:hypothetical protein
MNLSTLPAIIAVTRNANKQIQYTTFLARHLEGAQGAHGRQYEYQSKAQDYSKECQFLAGGPGIKSSNNLVGIAFLFMS